MTAAARPGVQHQPARRLATPLAAALAVGGATLAVAIRDPHTVGSWGYCPWLLLTGTFCPGCGGLRAVHDLAHLHPVQALSDNALVVVLAAVTAVGWVLWVRAAFRGRPAQLTRRAGPWLAYGLVGVLLLFSVLRNLPAGAWLAPDLVW